MYNLRICKHHFAVSVSTGSEGEGSLLELVTGFYFTRETCVGDFSQL